MNVFDVLREKLEEAKSDWNNDYNVPINNAIEIVNQVEQEYNNGWIPCSERLPEKNTWVLVTRSNGIIDMDMYKSRGWICIEDFVIAWQPLPEPFRENNIPRKQTNADRIRAMSDEALADEMLKFTDVCEQINFCHNDQMCNDTLDRGELIEKEMCKRCLLNWLGKEAK